MSPEVTYSRIQVVPTEVAIPRPEVVPDKVRLNELPQGLYEQRVKAASYMASDLGIPLTDEDLNMMLDRSMFESNRAVALLEDLQERISILGGDAMRLALDNIPDDIFGE